MREAFATRWSNLVDPIARVLARPDARPSWFFGHSLGALLAFEVVRKLRRMGARMPRRLFVSASAAPHLRAAEPSISALSDEQFVRELVQRYGGIPDALLADQAFLRMFIDILRADLLLLEHYSHQPEPALEIPITAFCGDADQVVSMAHVGPWHEHTCSQFRLRSFEGGHFYLKQHARSIALEINADRRTDLDAGEGLEPHLAPPTLP